jgi:ubiquinone/menaquinone biosynthesis C-methylase UbiE
MSSGSSEPTKEAAVILRMAFAFVTSQVVYQAAELSLADHLSSGGLSARELADKIGVDLEALERVLEALVAFGVLKHEGEAKFGLTAIGELLRSDVPGSLRATVRFLAGRWAWRAFEQLGHSIGTGNPSFDHVWGMSNFEYWERHPDVLKIHDDAMTGLTATETARILAAYDFSPYRKIVDVGGGNGALLAAILDQHRQTDGILADLPHVVSLATEVLQRAGVADRCKLIGSDFFERVPSGGNLYILKHVIHNWDDARARAILRNCHRVMGESARLLIIDRVLSARPGLDDAMGYLVDMTMLALTPGGRERNKEQFQRLLESSGFELTHVIETGGISDVTEARPH